MLSIFPTLLNYSIIGIFLLRGTVGVFFFVFGMRLLQAAWNIDTKITTAKLIGLLYGGLKLAVGTLLLLGYLTQPAVLLGALLSLTTILQDKPTRLGKSDKQVQILLFILCISLLFLGPGYLSIDLPL